MYSKKVKNTKNILKFKKTELNLKLYKFIFIYLLNLFQIKKSTYNSIELRSLKNKIFYFNSFITKISKVKLIRNCILTNRSRAVYRPYGFSRCALKDLIQFGKLPGMHKSIW